MRRDASRCVRRWTCFSCSAVSSLPPTFSPPGGEFKTPVKVRLTDEDPAAVIRYTLDGSVPNRSSPAYDGPIEIKGPTTLRAKAFKEGATRSISAQETYIVGE